MKIHDITADTVPGGVTWENAEAGFHFDWEEQISESSPCNVSKIILGTHTSTHLDAPLHFVAGGRQVQDLDLGVLVGKAVVVDVGDAKAIGAQELAAAHIPAGTQRVLFKSDNSRRNLLTDPSFHSEYVGVAPDGAQWLVDHGIRLVGVDYISVGSYGDPNVATHKTLLGAECIVVEGLQLTAVDAGEYTLVCLPPKFVGLEGSPCRAILIEGAAGI